MKRIHKIPPASHTTLLMPMLSAFLLALWKVHQNGAKVRVHLGASKSWARVSYDRGEPPRSQVSQHRGHLWILGSPLVFQRIQVHDNSPSKSTQAGNTLTGPGSWTEPKSAPQQKSKLLTWTCARVRNPPFIFLIIQNLSWTPHGGWDEHGPVATWNITLHSDSMA
jgi:hypothetical protein